MTPTDALIEKMARAICGRLLLGPGYRDHNLARLWKQRIGKETKDLMMEYARAAYSAEHEEDGK